MSPFAKRRDRLAQEMAQRGLWPDRSPWIRRAMETAPRHAFAPRSLWRWDGYAYVAVDREVDEDGWADAVYGGPYDPAIVQVTEGVATSSLSCPSVVADMLDSLRLAPGCSVLELGTATGWNAALLAARAGPGHVTSVEYDSPLAASAREKLAAMGWEVRVERGDGSAGWPPGAPYDRLIATYAVETVPWAWVAQTRPGGRIVTPWGRLGHVALTVAEDGGSATGWVQGLAMFMPSRPAPPDAPGPPERADARERSVERELAPLWDDAHLLFALRVALPDVRVAPIRGEPPLMRLDDGAGSWADVTPNGDGGHARYGGPRRLMDEVEHAWDQWRAQGSPELYDYGLTVADGGRTQFAWAWDPDTGPRWPSRRAVGRGAVRG